MKSSILVLLLLFSSYSLGSVISRNDTSESDVQPYFLPLIPLAGVAVAIVATIAGFAMRKDQSESAKVIFYDGRNRSGIISYVDKDADCIAVNLKHGARSVDTKERCYYLFTRQACLGYAVKVEKGTIGRNDLTSWPGLDGSAMFSASPCADICPEEYLYTNNVRNSTNGISDYDEYDNVLYGPRRNIPGKCTILDTSFRVGLIAAPGLRWLQNSFLRRRFRAPITGVQYGYRDRVEYLRAEIGREHLDTGTQPTDAMRDYVRERGRQGGQRDQAGHIIAARLGGTGSERYNIFPQSPNINMGQWRVEEGRIYDVVRDHGTVLVLVNFHYPNDRSTRPDYFTIRVRAVGRGARAPYVMRFENP